MKPSGPGSGRGRGGPGRGGPGRGGPERGRPERGGSGPAGPGGPHLGGPPRDGPGRGGPDRFPDHQADKQSLNKAIGLLEALVAEHPDRPDYQRLLAMSYLESTKHREIARSEEGQHLRSEAIELLTGLVERFPNNPDYRFALSAAYAMGRPDTRRLDESEFDAYLKRLLIAEELLAELRRDHPNVPQYLAAQMQLFRHICMLHKGIGNNDDALETYRRALKLFQDSPADALTPETVMAVSEVYYRMVELLQRESRRDPEQKDSLLKEAMSRLEANAKLFEQTANPSADFGRLMRLTKIYKQLAEEFRDLGDDASADSVVEIMKQATKWAGPDREGPKQQ